MMVNDEEKMAGMQLTNKRSESTRHGSSTSKRLADIPMQTSARK